MKRKEPKNTIKLISGDVEAILCALDLVANADAGSAAQNRLNYLNCAAAAEKLRSGVYFLPQTNCVSYMQVSVLRWIC